MILVEQSMNLDTIIPRFNTWEIACADDSSGVITLLPSGGADPLQNTYLWSSADGFPLQGVLIKPANYG